MEGHAWQLLIYRLPPGSASGGRVGVWRELRRLGALPLQSGVFAAPCLGDLSEKFAAVAERVVSQDGTVYSFALALEPAEHARLAAEWSAMRKQEYAEIIEECETKFVREIEFEIFRNNLTAGEAEEIEADLDKIRAWFERVTARDWFEAPNRDLAAQAIEHCATLLDDFVQRVYQAEMDSGPSVEVPPRVAASMGVNEEPVRRGDGNEGVEGAGARDARGAPAQSAPPPQSSRGS